MRRTVSQGAAQDGFHPLHVVVRLGLPSRVLAPYNFGSLCHRALTLTTTTARNWHEPPWLQFFPLSSPRRRTTSSMQHIRAICAPCPSDCIGPSRTREGNRGSGRRRPGVSVPAKAVFSTAR